MVIASLVSFYVNKAVSNSLYGSKKDFNWEQPLTNLVWLTSIVSIVVAFVASKFLLGGVVTHANVAPARTIRICGGFWPASSPAARWPDRSSWNSPKSSSAPSHGT